MKLANLLLYYYSGGAAVVVEEEEDSRHVAWTPRYSVRAVARRSRIVAPRVGRVRARATAVAQALGSSLLVDSSFVRAFGSARAEAVSSRRVLRRGGRPTASAGSRSYVAPSRLAVASGRVRTTGGATAVARAVRSRLRVGNVSVSIGPDLVLQEDEEMLLLLELMED